MAGSTGTYKSAEILQLGASSSSSTDVLPQTGTADPTLGTVLNEAVMKDIEEGRKWVDMDTPKELPEDPPGSPWGKEGGCVLGKILENTRK